MCTIKWLKAVVPCTNLLCNCKKGKTNKKNLNKITIIKECMSSIKSVVREFTICINFIKILHVELKDIGAERSSMNNIQIHCKYSWYQEITYL